MASEKLEKKRKNGIYYTPDILAQFLVEPLINGGNVSIFDPAYGEGSLLLAAESVFKKKRFSNNTIDLFGCDTHPVNGLLEHLPKANLLEEDFFRFSSKVKHDIVLTNPPYVRHQSQERSLIKEYKRNHHELEFLSNSSDLWTYFLVKSISHLKEGGSIGAILPWSFIQADYAQELRKWLRFKFREIKVLALNNRYFESAQERIIVLWMTGNGQPTESIEFAFGKDVESAVVYHVIGEDNWLSNRVVSIKSDLNPIFSHLKTKLGFSEFGLFADSRIGVVTGANKYFIKEEIEARNLGFDDDQLIPIITTTKELPEVLNSGEEKLKRLICIDGNKSQTIRVNNYIDMGVESEFNLRSHSRMRKPWYAINKGKLPDAFFPYRVGKIPYLVLNECGVQSTNSVHRIYFKQQNDIEIKWVIVSMLSMYGQLSLEAHAKTYGRGMLKMEPGSLAKVLVLKENDSSISNVYKEIIEKLKNQEKMAAVELATTFLNKKFSISNNLQDSTKKAWKEIQETRSR